MPRCICCRRKNHLMITCKWCVTDFCPNCVLYEVHSCNKMSDMKKKYNEQNKNILLQNKVTEIKVLQI